MADIPDALIILAAVSATIGYIGGVAAGWFLFRK